LANAVGDARTSDNVAISKVGFITGQLFPKFLIKIKRKSKFLNYIGAIPPGDEANKKRAVPEGTARWREKWRGSC
jgi:hypothetical protein